MDKYYEVFKNIRGNRDIVFQTVLDYFNNRPIEILEIGCARNLDIGSRQSDGWSTCFWAEYVFTNGMNLDVYDISEESIKNCKEITNHWRNLKDAEFRIFFQTAPPKFNLDYDLAFLDGGDDPNQTLDQFKKCKEIDVGVVLIDDFHTKGTLIQDKPDTLWEWNNGHRMACFGGPKLGKVNLQLL